MDENEMMPYQDDTQTYVFGLEQRFITVKEEMGESVDCSRHDEQDTSHVRKHTLRRRLRLWTPGLSHPLWGQGGGGMVALLCVMVPGKEIGSTT